MMIVLDNPETFWLDATNLGLGVLCAICWLLVLGGVVRALVLRRRRRLASVVEFHAALNVGTTMADGGTPLRSEPEDESDGDGHQGER